MALRKAEVDAHAGHRRALLRLKYEMAALRVSLALVKFERMLDLERRYNPFHDDLGRFTTAIGVGGGMGGNRDGRVRVAQAGPAVIPSRATTLARFPNATPAQEARLAVSDVLARREKADTQALIPDYRPGPSISEGIEGEIARNEADAQAARVARARYESENLTGGAGPVPGTAPKNLAELCYPGGSPVGVQNRGAAAEVRTLTPEEFAPFLREITRDAVLVQTPARYQGQWYRSGVSEIVGIRVSERFGITIDIVKSSSSIVPRNFKVHCK